MPIDPSALLGAKTVEIPNPLTLAGQGLTLGNLANQNALGNLQVQQMQQMQRLYSDPKYMESLAPLFGGGGGGDTAPLMEALRSNPLAAQQVFSSLLAMKKVAAETGKAGADTAEVIQKRNDAAKEDLANTAYAATQNPSPATFKSVLMQIDHMQNNLGINASTYIDPTDLVSGDPQKTLDSLKTLAGMRLTPDKAKSMQEIDTKMWATRADTALKYYTSNPSSFTPNTMTGELMATKPQAGPPPALPPAPGFGGPPAGSQPGQGTPMAPPAAQNVPGAPQPAPGYAGASGVPLNDPKARIAILQKELEGEPPDSPNRPLIQKEIDRLAPSVASGEQVRGTGVQTAPGAKQGEMIKGAVGEFNNLQASAQAAPQIQSLVDELRQKEASGIYSGGIAGTDFFTTLANRLQGAGFLGPEAATKLANTQAWTADTGNLVAQAIKAWVGSGGRVAAREIDYFKNLKPQLLQTPEGRAQIYQELYNMSGRQQQQAAQAADWLKTHDDLGGFAPTFTPTKMKPITLDQLPPPEANAGKTFVGDKGAFRSDGTKWILVGPPPAAGMAMQVPR